MRQRDAGVCVSQSGRRPSFTLERQPCREVSKGIGRVLREG